MKEIQLTQGKVAFVDDEDYEQLNQHKWCAVHDGYNWYAARKLRRNIIKMHDCVLDVPSGMEVDHKDRNGLNNQKSNVRICTHSQNIQNQFRPTLTRSGFKGVTWKSKNNKWCAQIKNGHKRHLGLYNTALEAAIAYDKAASEIYGEFALTNRKLGLIPAQPVPEPSTVLKDA